MKQILLIVVFLWSKAVYADVVVTVEKRYFGKILEITSLHVKIQDGCNGDTIKINWTDKIWLKFSSDCEDPGYTETGATSESEKCKGQKFFIIKPASGDIIYATKMSVSKKKLVLELYATDDPPKQIQIPLEKTAIRTKIRSVAFRRVCMDMLPKKIPSVDFD